MLHSVSPYLSSRGRGSIGRCRHRQGSDLLSFQFHRDLFHNCPTEVVNSGAVGVCAAIQHNVESKTHRPGNDDIVLSKIRKANGQDLVRIDCARVVRNNNLLAITCLLYTSDAADE